MAIDFPNSPSLNDSFTVSGKTWVYNGTAWVLVTNPTAIPDGAITASMLSGMGASSGDFLKYDGSTWTPDQIPAINTLDDVGDVSAPTPSTGQFLQWNGTAWVAATASTDVMTSTKNAALITMDIGV